MSSRFFISRRLKKEIENDLKKRSMIEEKINKDMEAFKDEIDDETVISIFEFIEKYGNKKQKESLSEIKTRYNNSSLLIDDTLKLVDWYDKMCNFYNSKDEMD
jgi:hypothetical protein